MRRTFREWKRTIELCFAATLLALAAASGVTAQSTDLEYPTPVLNNEINGRIAPRDVGDPRLTRHFYTFTGLQGDLVITVESMNLNGDVDLFTASNLRPLTKVTLYAGLSSTTASKTIYLRREEALIMRIEARSPNDNDGSYRIRLEGAFAAAKDATPPPENLTASASATKSPNSNVRRVTSVGGRIEESKTEETTESKRAAESKPAEPAPARSAEAKRLPPAKSPPTRSGPARRESARTRPARPTPTRPAPPAKTESAKSEPIKSGAVNPEPIKPEAAKPEPAKTNPAKTETVKALPKRAEPIRTARARPPARRRAESGITTAKKSAPATPPARSKTTAAQPVLNTRLIIETKDGGKLERSMNTVLRITVENGLILITTKDGKTEKQSMANVLRMSIEP